VKVAFQKKATTFFGRFIRLWTGGIYSHTELVFSNGVMFSSDEQDGGSRFLPGPKKGAEYDYINVPMSAEDERRILQFCKAEDGCHYDKIGIGFSFLPIPLGYQNADAWFCSEICTAALQLAGYCVGYTPARIHPNKLYKLLNKDLHGRNCGGMFKAAMAMLVAMMLVGCAYNSITITTEGAVTVNASTSKPVDISTQGNVPLQGGTVSNPSQVKDLSALRDYLSVERIGTDVEDPLYKEIEGKYREANDTLAKDLEE
jgi:hypothetical protein